MTTKRGIRRPDFTQVKPTEEELADWAKKNPNKRPPYRAEHDRCGKRIWYSGIAIVGHTQACPGKRPEATEVVPDLTIHSDTDGDLAPKPIEVPFIPAAIKPEVLAYREVACLRLNDHVTIKSLTGQLEVLVVENHAGDDADVTKAYALGVERHTHARVTIQAQAIQNHVYSLWNRWHDDPA